jgi:hypothetical protein
MVAVLLQQILLPRKLQAATRNPMQQFAAEHAR